MMMKKCWKKLCQYFAGDPSISPFKLTLFQSTGATVLASILAVIAYNTVGVYYAGIWYQLGVTLVIASFVAPIFLFPSYRTSGRLQRANAIIKAQATTDHLTGLPNMLALNNQLKNLLTDDKNQTAFALHFLDIDRFKQVNDSLGHDVGNELIIETGRRIQDWVGNAGFVARFGGDEFVVIQFATSNELAATHFGRELRVHLAKRYNLSDHEINVTASIGTALSPFHGTNQEQLLKAADLALYKAKETGHASCVFEPRFASEASNRRRIEGILRDTIEKGTLIPYFHSIVQAKNPLQIAGFEALCRIELPDGEILNPEQFIPIAESTGLILDIGAHMLQQACIECASWHPDLFVSVNVSPVQMIRSDFLTTVQEALNDSGLPPYRLELEITESVLINDVEHIRTTLERVRALGVQIALDDFGAGYCGLHYLRQIEIDKIKIDKSIIDDAATVEISRNILNGVSLIAKQMEITLVAEGVDDITKAEFLSKGECVHQFQGYLFSKPVNAVNARRMQEILPSQATGSNVIQLPVKSNDRA
ncbi:bifunctional diguanylate cyclase/phosphodiesterase [uncultured Maritalea sp.]|uniref:putative bifunctional diguanylate cyclase/phosphodiesterase n=1 Tax=uncultured Maritalea sp. TaxID=757249 RepID=UPI0026146CC7|nr:bifunctional diguanylate cyclase/phosphodiesterase [uncultured Maritalea sp.]